MGFASDGADLKQLDNLLDRHNIAYVKSNASFKLDNFYKNNLDIVRVWIRNSYPFIVARQENVQDGVKLAISTVEKNHKIKVATFFDSQDIVWIQSPPNLKEVSLYYDWDTKAFNKNEMYVYGSYTISYLTKQKFFTDTSDIDILLVYKDQSISYLSSLLRDLQARLKRRIDIEIRFKNIGDINLRELIGDKTNDLICKAKSSVYVINKKKLYELKPTLYKN